mmetsp:Transcript_21538/g.47912  ORF Transcript_21538/g.47912 Transcript_21538/m.47912 type:complete len:284 (-) Transcript_21538:3626-4477(-)
MRSMSVQNCRMALCSRSGRKACTMSTRWKGVTPRKLGRSLSASKDVANLCHFAEFSSSREVIRCGSCSDSRRKASLRSLGAQEGYPRGTASLTEATSPPVKISHSRGWKWSVCIPLTRCKANMERSALNSARPTKYSVRTSRSAANVSSLSSIRLVAVSAFSACLNRVRKEARENWYMWFSFCRAFTRKYSFAPASAKGRYTSLCSSSFTEASALCTSASSISPDFSFVRVSDSISDVFSSRLPSAVASSCSRSFSSFANCTLKSSSLRSISPLAFSSSGCSF